MLSVKEYLIGLLRNGYDTK